MRTFNFSPTIQNVFHAWNLLEFPVLLLHTEWKNDWPFASIWSIERSSHLQLSIGWNSCQVSLLLAVLIGSSACFQSKFELIHQSAKLSLDVLSYIECYPDIEDCVQSAPRESFGTILDIEKPESLDQQVTTDVSRSLLSRRCMKSNVSWVTQNIGAEPCCKHDFRKSPIKSPELASESTKIRYVTSRTSSRR